MEVGRTEGPQGPGRIQGPGRPARIPPSDSVERPTDRVEISNVARLVSETIAMPSVRQEKIQGIRNLLESGRFDTPERLAGAIDRFLEENEDLLI